MAERSATGAIANALRPYTCRTRGLNASYRLRAIGSVGLGSPPAAQIFHAFSRSENFTFGIAGMTSGKLTIPAARARWNKMR